MKIHTLAGQPASRLGLASQYLTDETCVAAAVEAGINYVFFYSLPADVLLKGLHPLLSTQREQLLITTGSESRQLKTLRQQFNQVRHHLDSDMVDIFFAEYLSPVDQPAETAAVLEELYRWKTEGSIRYVGVSTHDRSIALQLIEQGQCDVLMHRYNMAHRKAEAMLLPTAAARGIPVIAFTCTRWGTLLQGHPDWTKRVPTAADCYRYVLQHPAVQLALTAPETTDQLQENLAALQASELTPQEIEQWQTYGDLVYGNGQDSFETQWL